MQPEDSYVESEPICRYISMEHTLQFLSSQITIDSLLY